MLLSRVYFDPNVSTSSHEAIPLSGKRRTLTIYPSGNDTVTLSNDPNVVSGNGIVLLPGGPALYLDDDFHGSIVREAFYAIYVTGGMPISYVQGIG